MTPNIQKNSYQTDRLNSIGPVLSANSFVYLFPEYYNPLMERIILGVESDIESNLKSNSLDTQRWNLNFKLSVAQLDHLTKLDNQVACDRLPLDFNGSNIITTLFKDDYQAIPAWVSWYSNLGFDGFILYYNGKLDAIREFLSDHLAGLSVNLMFVEWDVSYWSWYESEHPATRIEMHLRHHAQPLMQNHALYLSKSRFKNIAFFDLDEYLIAPDICRHLTELASGLDTVIFESRWAELRPLKRDKPFSAADLQLNLDKFNGKASWLPNFFGFEVFVDSNNVSFPSRTKYISNLDKLAIAGVHLPHVFVSSEQGRVALERQNFFLHFHNFTGKPREGLGLATERWNSLAQDY